MKMQPPFKPGDYLWAITRVSCIQAYQIEQNEWIDRYRLSLKKIKWWFRQLFQLYSVVLKYVSILVFCQLGFLKNYWMLRRLSKTFFIINARLWKCFYCRSVLFVAAIKKKWETKNGTCAEWNTIWSEIIIFNKTTVLKKFGK